MTAEEMAGQIAGLLSTCPEISDRSTPAFGAQAIPLLLPYAAAFLAMRNALDGMPHDCWLRPSCPGCKGNEALAQADKLLVIDKP